MPQPLALDTPPSAEARQIAFFQQRAPHERMALMFDLVAFLTATSREAIRRANPTLSKLEQARLFGALQFGAEYATRVCQYPTIEGTMAIPAALLPITRMFQQLGIAYYVGGSIASTAYSLPRSTYDIDIACDIQARHVAPFVAELGGDYYIERSAVLDAITHREREASFNITHHATGINIDIFVTAGRPFDRSRYLRAQDHLLPGTAELVKLASPEDIVLNKLLWFRQDGIESEKQWRDVQAIVRVQLAALDRAYLRQWASGLGIGDLLEAALRGDLPPRTGADTEPSQGRLF